MKILGIDTTGQTASAALVEGDKLIAEFTMNYKLTHSQTILPMIADILERTETDKASIDCIACACGPGSFTGLRIGAATAKGFALALDKPIVAVPTLDALAYNVFETNKFICPIMDARRNQVYTGIYEFRGNTMEVLEPQMAVDIEVIAEKLCERQRDVIFLGDGVPVFKDKLCNGLMDKLHDCGKEFYFAPAHVNKQRAGAVGALALRYLEEGKTETAEEHQPEYLRMAQAERERAEKLAKGEGTC